MYAYNMQHLNTAVICSEIIVQNHRAPKSSSYRVQSHDVPKLLYHIMNHHRLPNISSAFNFAKPTVQRSLPSYLYNELQTALTGLLAGTHPEGKDSVCNLHQQQC